jgi:hypothetical protein
MPQASAWFAYRTKNISQLASSVQLAPLQVTRVVGVAVVVVEAAVAVAVVAEVEGVPRVVEEAVAAHRQVRASSHGNCPKFPRDRPGEA